MTSKLRKHIDNDQDAYILPEEEQKIARVIGVRGGNLVEVEFDDASTTLCIIPTKYRKKVWIKKGGFVFVDVAPADDTYKVQGQIAHVLNKDQIEYCKENDCWPKAFINENEDSIKRDESNEELFAMGNPNRNRGLFVSDSEDDETTDDEEEDSLEASISDDDEE